MITSSSSIIGTMIQLFLFLLEDHQWRSVPAKINDQ